MDEIKKALLGDKESQYEITQKGHLLPCHCCKSSMIKLKQNEQNGKIYYECCTCGARSKEVSVLDYLRLVWNTRPQLLTAEEMKRLEGLE